MTTAEILKKHKSFLRAAHGQNPRFCTTCKMTKPREGGIELAYNNGKNARWVCASCKPKEL